VDPVLQALAAVQRSPGRDELWRLRAELLAAGVPGASPVWEVLDRFRDFMDRLATGTSSREYSDLASKLDISAVGGVVLEHVFEAEDPKDLGRRLLAAVVSEGLMVLATRQHVKAWEGALAAVLRDAAWYLYGELWRWTVESKPDLPPADRRKLLDELLAPVHAETTSGLHKAVLLGVLFQVVLIARVTAPSSGAGR